MVRKVKVMVDGQERDALEQDFEVVHEGWNEYKLLDGGRVRVKNTVMRIARILDDQGKPAFNKEGEPLMFIRHNTLLSAND